jgi:hypothetical protein
MPIRAYLDGHIAFEMARAALRLADREDLNNQDVANKIIDLAVVGERNPEVLCEGALTDLPG